MVANNDFRDLPAIIAADAVFHSPVEWHPYPGRDLICLLLGTAAGIYRDFRYHRKLVDADSVALEFSAHIGDVELKAVHLIRFNEAGEFADIEILMRPSKGVRALGKEMAPRVGPVVKEALEAQRRAATGSQPA